MSRFCGRCGRELTNPESQRRGYGPVCWAKLTQDTLERIQYEQDLVLEVKVVKNPTPERPPRRKLLTLFDWLEVSQK